MTRYLLRRVLRMVITAWLVVTFVFVVLRVSGDPIEALVPADIATPDLIEYYRTLYGLDRSLPVQYFGYLRGLLAGDLGVSFQDGRDAIDVVLERLPATLQLASVSFVMMLLIGLPSGVFAALNRGRLVDRLIMSIAVAGYSMPQYLLGILLIWIFAVELQWLPSSGSNTYANLVLPAITMALFNGAMIARFTRSGVLEVLGLPHVRAAAAQGWPQRTIVIREILPNAAIPLITVIGYITITLVTGSILVEWVYGWPGIGRLLIQSVGERNLPVVQILVLMFAMSAVIINFIADTAYAFFNPKIRLSHDS